MALAILPDKMAEGAVITWREQKSEQLFYGGHKARNRDWPFDLAEAVFKTPVMDASQYHTFLNLFETHGTHTAFLVLLRSRYTLTDEPMAGTVGGGNKVFTLQESITVGNTTITRPLDYPLSMTYADSGGALTVDTENLRTITFTTVPVSQPEATGTFRRLMTFVEQVRVRVMSDEAAGEVLQSRLLEEFPFT